MKKLLTICFVLLMAVSLGAQ